MIVDEAHPDDGLREFAVWVEWNAPNDRYDILQIKEVDSTFGYNLPKDCAGIVRAKDELDAYRFMREYR